MSVTQEFDVKQFNVKFDAMKTKVKEENMLTETKILNQLNTSNSTSVPVYLQSPLDMMFNIKNTWFDIYDELILNGISINLFYSDLRLFYVGLTFILFALMLYSLRVFVDEE